MKNMYEDLNNAYSEVRKKFPGEVAKFCCDLGDRWLFKFAPRYSKGWISGHFGIVIDKNTGEVAQYDMAVNSKEYQDKINLANML